MKRFIAFIALLACCMPAWAIERNIGSQTLELFAFDSTTGAPKTGDAANLTAYVSLDGDATPDALGDTSATEISSTNAPGWYRFDLTQAETNGKNILFSGKSATANIVLVGRYVATHPANLSLTAIDSSGNAAADVQEINNDTAAADNLDDILDEGGGSGVDLALQSLAVSAATGNAVSIVTSGGNGNGVAIVGNGTGAGISTTGGATGVGFVATGAGYGGRFIATAGVGLGANGTTSHTEGIIDTGSVLTADSGSATTLVDSALNQADNDWWKGMYVQSLSGTTSGQIRRIASFTASSDTLTFDRAFTAAISTNSYRILAASADSNAEAWLGTLAATPTTAGVPEVDVTHWLGTAAATPTVAGVPEVDMVLLNGGSVTPLTPPIQANVTQFGGVNGMFAGGIPNTNAHQFAGVAAAATNAATAFNGGSYNVGGGGINVNTATSVTNAVTTGGFNAAALNQLVLSDTGQAAAGVGSVAKLAQGSSDPEVFLDAPLGTHPDGSVGDRLLTIPNATAGASGGLLIAGSNAATTFATLTSTGAFSTNGADILTRINTALELDGAVYRLTTNALEQAPSGAQTNPQVMVSTTVDVVTTQTEFTLAAGSSINDSYTGRAIVLYDASNSDFPFQCTVQDYIGSTRTITLDQAPGFTLVSGDGVKVFVGSGADTVASSGGPVEQRSVAPARRLQARSRGDGTFGIVGGQRIRMLPGETLMWSVDFRGTQIPNAANLFGMSAPSFTGAQSAQMTTVDYGVDDSEAKFEITLSGAATTASVINVVLTVQPTGSETIIVTIPVTVGS
jgi:hypothetical protein